MSEAAAASIPPKEYSYSVLASFSKLPLINDIDDISDGRKDT